MGDKLSKFINVLKKDGIFKTLKKTYKYCMANYINKINIIRKIEFKLNKNKIQEELERVFKESTYDRVIVWRGSFGWSVPLYQRPQHIANCLSNSGCLILYEVTRMTDKTKFIEKFKDNLFLVNYEIKEFDEMLWQTLKKVDKKKYLQLYSTCWDVSDSILNKYVNNDFTLLYEYIDDLNPVLAGTKELPENVKKIHEYVCKNPSSVLVVTSADKLYEDITNKRKSKENVILSANGVEYEHFAHIENKEINDKKYKDIIDEGKPIIGYYGALASWFDYELIKHLSNELKDINIVLFGIKYDDSFDENKLEKFKNIHYLGPINYNKLPEYAQFFNVCIIPFIINEITLSTNPIKVFEYMALGKPIVTTAMPECKKYKSVFIANDYNEFKKLIENSVKLTKEKDQEYFKILKEEALQNTWQSRAQDILDLLIKTENEG